MEKDAGAARRAFSVGHAIDLRAPGALFRRHDEDTCRSQTHHRRTRFGFAWGLGYDGSHLASGCHREKWPGSALPYQQRRAAEGFHGDHHPPSSVGVPVEGTTVRQDGLAGLDIPEV